MKIRNSFNPVTSIAEIKAALKTFTCTVIETIELWLDQQTAYAIVTLILPAIATQLESICTTQQATPNDLDKSLCMVDLYKKLKEFSDRIDIGGTDSILLIPKQMYILKDILKGIKEFDNFREELIDILTNVHFSGGIEINLEEYQAIIETQHLKITQFDEPPFAPENEVNQYIPDDEQVHEVNSQHSCQKATEHERDEVLNSCLINGNFDMAKADNLLGAPKYKASVLYKGNFGLMVKYENTTNSVFVCDDNYMQIDELMSKLSGKKVDFY